MKSSRFFITALFSSLAVAFFTMVSCDKSGPDQDEEQDVLEGNSIMVAKTANSTAVFTLDMADSWEVDNTSAWFTVYPLSGEAGSVEFTVTALEDNPEAFKERVSDFMIKCGGTNTRYYVIQDVNPGFNITKRQTGVIQEENDCVVTVEGNVDYEAVPDVDWITVNDIKHETTLLDDGKTESKYTVSRISMHISRNTGKVRTGNVILTGVDDQSITATVSVSQMGELEAEFSRDFLRRSVVMRFTATWCTNCPLMNSALGNAISEDPEHIIPLNLHASSSTGGLAYDQADAYFSHFDLLGYPTGVVNDYAEVANSSAIATTQAVFNGLADEAVESLPANTMVGGEAVIADGEVKVRLSVASKSTGDYLVSVFILEDGIIYSQEGGASNYEHNSIARDEMTPMWGEPVSLTAGNITNLEYSMPVPSSVLDEDRLHVLAIVNRTGSFKGNVTYATYNDWGYVTDNAADIPGNGFTDFGYEN